MPTVKTTEELKKHLLSHRIVNENGCWIWTMTRNNCGYGKVQHNHKIVYVHILSFKLFSNNYDVNLQVLHKCDTPPCFNPEHLYQGTQKENIQDAMVRGRHIKSKERIIASRHHKIKFSKN
jgi:hypothetical protein